MSLRLKLIQSAWLAFSAANLLAQAQLTEHRVFIPERGEVVGYLVSTSTNHYAFLPPPTWRVSCKPGAASVVMVAEDLRTSITIDFINNPDGEQTPFPKEAPPWTFERRSATNNPSYPRARELVSTRYRDGRPGEAFALPTGIAEGLGFDVERRGANGARLVSRVVYVATEWGVIEFTLTAPRRSFAEAIITFGNVINSFHRPAR